MEKLLGVKFNRQSWSIVLAAAAVFSLVGAWVFDAAGLGAPSMTPMSFVLAVILTGVGAYLFLPVMKEHGPQASVIIKDVIAETRKTLARYRLSDTKKHISLWDENDPRVDMSLFTSNVPTFVLNHEQRFLDWNIAFDLIFGHSHGIKRGAHISAWFDHLENFKRVSVRSQKLYGEGILPIADRERATYMSHEFGRMVFTKIMSPIIDRQSGRIIGWNVVLNINSVNKRNEFLDKLYKAIELETRRIRYASSFDGLFSKFSGYRSVAKQHLQIHQDAQRVLEVGAGTGLLSCRFAATGIRMTAVDGDVHALRRLRDKRDLNALPIKIIKQHPEDMKGLPDERFDGAVMMLNAHKSSDLVGVLKKVHAALKPGASISISTIDPNVGIEGFYNSLRDSLDTNGHFENLKHQFNHVVAYDQDHFRHGVYRYVTREDLRAALLEAGFLIAGEKPVIMGGSALMVIGKK